MIQEVKENKKKKRYNQELHTQWKYLHKIKTLFPQIAVKKMCHNSQDKKHKQMENDSKWIHGTTKRTAVNGKCCANIEDFSIFLHF